MSIADIVKIILTEVPVINILAIVLLVLAIRWLVIKEKKRKKERPNYKEQAKTYQEEPPEPKKPETKNYYVKQIMTIEERHAYDKLKQYASYNFMHVFPKVKVLTFVKLQNGPHYPYLKEKLGDKHVDFVVLDQSMNVKTIIEMDGCNPEWTGPDKIKDQVLKELGFKVIHAKYITQETLKQI